ncbi:uncharacterized protein G2W53_038037 [Senna tora]|uniref:Uncharacterized protein n=1 Tax=Senna tora TaxID=362788 RepID=A0A834SLU0_9FABA|nr:uncharacterized protein G2W53_038037 [Senna tora]
MGGEGIFTIHMREKERSKGEWPQTSDITLDLSGVADAPSLMPA